MIKHSDVVLNTGANKRLCWHTGVDVKNTISQGFRCGQYMYLNDAVEGGDQFTRFLAQPVNAYQTFCKPIKNIPKSRCDYVVKTCNHHGIPMKWAGPFDGCQCEAYCAYHSEKQCRGDHKFCYWEGSTSLGKCYSKLTNSPGIEYQYCNPGIP